MTNKEVDLNSLQGKYLTFNLDKEEYGIPLLSVREIIGLTPITSVPKTPKYVKGVINLRGKVIPVIDLRTRFGLKQQEYHDRTCIIIVEMDGEAGLVPVGMVVDTVSEVANILSENIESADQLKVSSKKLNYILGIAKSEKTVTILLNIQKVLTLKTIQKIGK